MSASMMPRWGERGIAGVGAGVDVGEHDVDREPDATRGERDMDHGVFDGVAVAVAQSLARSGGHPPGLGDTSKVTW